MFSTVLEQWLVFRTVACVYNSGLCLEQWLAFGTVACVYMWLVFRTVACCTPAPNDDMCVLMI